MQATTAQDTAERQARRYLDELKEDQNVSIRRLFMKMAKPNTRKAYAHALVFYFRWLRSTGVDMTPDQMVKDNLVSIFKSDPIDVQAKRKHTDLLDSYVNRFMLEQGKSDSLRIIAATAVSMFYSRNDSPLWGDFEVSIGRPSGEAQPLFADDIRAVLKAMPLGARTACLGIWQGGVEVNRILGLRWKDVDGGGRQVPLRLTFIGRKKHRRKYEPREGKDFVDHLKMWRPLSEKRLGRKAGPDDLVFQGKPKGGETLISGAWLNKQLQETAARLFAQGLIRNGDPKSWHTHALRHSFETEGSHGGARKEVLGYLEGHLRDIMWVYNHRDDVHPEDLDREYLEKIEPFVSLDPSAAEVRRELEQEFREENKQLRQDVDYLLRSMGVERKPDLD